jgi:hypothetical protein
MLRLMFWRPGEVAAAVHWQAAPTRPGPLWRHPGRPWPLAPHYVARRRRSLANGVEVLKDGTELH